MPAIRDCDWIITWAPEDAPRELQALAMMTNPDCTSIALVSPAISVEVITMMRGNGCAVFQSRSEDITCDLILRRMRTEAAMVEVRSSQPN